MRAMRAIDPFGCGLMVIMRKAFANTTSVSRDLLHEAGGKGMIIVCSQVGY